MPNKRFIKGTTVMLDSPKGSLMRRNMADFPHWPIEEHLIEATRLLDEAAGRKNYRVLTLAQDRAMRQRLAKRREKLGSGQESRRGPSGGRS